jgi:tetratricopeptide (TPR) repeat protein
MHLSPADWPAISTLLDEAAETHRRAMGPGLRPIGQHRFELARARLRLATGESLQALERLRSLAEVDMRRTRVPIERVRTQALLAAAHLQRDDLPAAAAAANAALAAIEASDLRRYYTGLEAEALLRQTQVLLRGGRSREAKAALERAAALRAASDHPSSPWLAQVELALAQSIRPDAGAARMEAQARRRLARQPQLGAHLMRGL